MSCLSPAPREREGPDAKRREGEGFAESQGGGTLTRLATARHPLPRCGRGASGDYSSPFFFRISSALLASIVSVGSVIFFSTVWPAVSFRPWRTPSAPGVA